MSSKTSTGMRSIIFSSLVRVLNKKFLVRSVRIKVSCSLLKESSFVKIVESSPEK